MSANKQQGTICFVGPHGSGKSTALGHLLLKLGAVDKRQFDRVSKETSVRPVSRYSWVRRRVRLRGGPSYCVPPLATCALPGCARANGRPADSILHVEPHCTAGRDPAPWRDSCLTYVCHRYLASRRWLHFGQLLDNLKAERERSMTVDVKLARFETVKCSYGVIDTPGHPDYLANAIAGITQVVQHPGACSLQGGKRYRGRAGGGAMRES